jgi:orotate phosphoribosyltransferase
MFMETAEILEVLQRTGALLDGHFELRSGLHSDRFFQCANLLRYPRLASDLCVALTDKMREAMNSELRVDTVLAPALGGIVVGHEVARNLETKSIFAEKQDNKLVMRRFEIREGERFVVAEDVVTRGGRVQECIDIIEARGGIVTAVAVLVNRSGGKAQFGCPTFSLLEMEPVTFDPESCPLCEKGLPLVHPGS